MAKLFLVDGSNHAFRVQFALPPMSASSGFPTRALYGFTTLFAKMLREHRPEYVAVCFDTARNFRKAIYPDYKGHRPEMPEDLAAQWPHFRTLVEGFGATYLAVDGYEADDVIGTLARRFRDEVDVFLVTGDKDFFQLVDDRVRVLDLMKDEEIGPAEVEAKMGVPPERITDLLGLVGDTSDNIPGIPGIGPKKATRFLQRFGTLEGVLAHADDIGGKTGQRVAEHADDARLSKRLATIALDAPVDLPLEALRRKPLDTVALGLKFDEWEFGPIARKILGVRPVVDPSVWRVARTPEAVQEAVDAAREAGRVGLGVHLDGDDPRTATLLGVSLSWSPTDAVYVPWCDPAGGGLAEAARRGVLAELLEDPDVPVVTHDAKRLLHAADRAGLQIAGPVHDTMLADYVVAAHERAHDLEAVSVRHLNYTPVDFPANGPRRRDLFEDPLVYEETHRLAAEPAHLAMLLHPRLDVRLEGRLRDVYRDIELPLVPILARMEQVGIRVDRDRLAAIREEVAGRVEAARDAAFEAAGRPFDIDGRKELQALLFEELGLPAGKKTKAGYSTDASVLERLADLHPLPARILDYRKLTKLLSTYLDALPACVAADGRIHTSFNQAVAATGRLSSNHPNLQNIPVRTPEGRRIREAFVPEPGWRFVSADYSQIELRILAHLCGSGPLVEAFRAGEDIHARTAAEVFGVSPDAVDPAMRNAAKAINFGLIYGMSAFRLAGDLAIGRDEAASYIEGYFARLPKVREWIEATRAGAKEAGYVETLFGRRRLIPDIHSRRYAVRMAAEREATNTPVQGSAADLVKIAMIRVDDALRAGGFRARQLLQVHDELLLEVPEDEVDAVCPVIVEAMTSVADLAVPLVVNTAVGDNWEQAHG